MYYIDFTTHKCSKCGSTNYERFSDKEYTGIRCLNCKHEKKEKHPHLTTTDVTGNYTFSLPNKKEDIF